MTIKHTIYVDVYRIVSDAVERGVRLGWNRAHKHVDAPDEDLMCDKIEQAVMEEISSYVQFSEPGEEE